MGSTYTLANPNCLSCINNTNNKPLSESIYNKNVFRIPDSFNTNATLFNATNFFAFSFAESGSFVYKVSGEKVDLQKIEFANIDTLYVSRKSDKWVLGGVK